MLPDLTITALFAASLIFASSAALRPVVPTICVLPALATSAAKATVATGAVKSMMPSAFASSGPASPASLIPFSGRPARTPASQPIRGERTSSSAPASENSLLSAIALTSVRPIRPPAPATIRRISAIVQLREICGGYSGTRASGHLPRLWLRSIVALDHDQVRIRAGLSQCNRLGIFRRAIAPERRFVAGKFDNDDTAAVFSLHHLHLAAARHVPPAIFAENIRQQR